MRVRTIAGLAAIGAVAALIGLGYLTDDSRAAPRPSEAQDAAQHAALQDGLAAIAVSSAPRSSTTH